MFGKIAVTGGAGFIGSHMVDYLIEKGHEVVVLDNLDKQAHADGKKFTFLNKGAKFVRGDICDKKSLEKAFNGVTGVFHFASAVGVEQSMYKMNYYVKNNSLGTSNLLEFLAKEAHDVKKIVVASSMSTYGEGLYSCESCGNVEPEIRPERQLKKKQWGVFCPHCKKPVSPVATPETKTQKPNSVYGITKKDQEDMCLLVGKTYGINVTGLRFFTVLGPRQPFNNPYTGVVKIFIKSIHEKKRPLVFEDGLQTRDFVSVHDVVHANYLALKSSNANFESFNVGSGKRLTIKEVAEKVAQACDSKLEPKIVQSYRKGDVRHCFADISKIWKKLEWEPKVDFGQSLSEIVEWLKNRL